MRFTTSTTLLILLLAIFNLALASKIMDSESIHDELTNYYLIRRADDNATASNSHHGSVSSSTKASAEIATITSSSKHGQSSNSTVPAATSTTSNKKKNASSFASPEILQTGTLFYVGVGVTTFLWITGKAIDVQTNRQERYAESLVHSI
ncbi:hypothetical protein [Parasitella parasitica]|uniref:Uncharacterized protein n=1 Tax=Parasitella parasitica TaxID=35722 RepID=A0A0B7N6T8_9FUNG|nr:hypothetical protein [Parasitella parasitica]